MISEKFINSGPASR